MKFELKNLAEDSWLTAINYYVPSAWFGHAPFLRFLIRESKPEIFVELGTHNGFSFFVGCQTIKEIGTQTKAFAIDHWKGDSHAGEFDELVFTNINNYNLNFDSFSKLIRMPFKDALDSFDDNSIDILHIDGFHTYTAVKEDFETWLPKMKNNGIILMHDIHVRRTDFGVYKFWNEIKQKYRTFEFVHSHGLGIVLVGDTVTYGNFHALVSGELGSAQEIQGVFGSLGDISTQQFVGHKEIDLQNQAYSVQNELNRLHNQISELEKILHQLLNSKSWFLTRPLRALMSIFKKLK